MSTASLELDLQDAAAQPAPAAGDFERWVAADVAGLREATELTVRLVDEDEGRELNARYGDKDYPTNVLSFPSALPEGLDLPYIGDVVICPAVVVREAAEQGKTEEAQPLLEDSYDVIRQEDEVTVVTIERMIALYDANGDDAKARLFTSMLDTTVPINIGAFEAFSGGGSVRFLRRDDR